jgi:hypothetical protein
VSGSEVARTVSLRAAPPQRELGGRTVSVLSLSVHRAMRVRAMLRSFGSGSVTSEPLTRRGSAWTQAPAAMSPAIMMRIFALRAVTSLSDHGSISMVAS